MWVIGEKNREKKTILWIKICNPEITLLSYGEAVKLLKRP